MRLRRPRFIWRMYRYLSNFRNGYSVFVTSVVKGYASWRVPLNRVYAFERKGDTSLLASRACSDLYTFRPEVEIQA